MSGKTSYPTDVLHAIEKFGDKAFRLNHRSIREAGEVLTRYVPFQFKKFDKQKGVYMWQDLIMMAKHCPTTGKIKPPGDVKKGGRGVFPANLSFRRSSVYTRTVSVKNKKTGKVEKKKIKEPFGEAFCRVAEWILRNAKEYIEGESDEEVRIYAPNKKIITKVQFKRKGDKVKGKYNMIDLDDPIVRVDLRHNKEGKFRFDIYDVKKKVKRSEKELAEGKLNFAYATIDTKNPDGTIKSVPVSPENVHEFIRPGSLIYAPISMSSMVPGDKGFSHPASVMKFMIVNQAKPAFSASSMVTMDDIDDMSGDVVEMEVDEEDTPAPKPKPKENVPDTKVEYVPDSVDGKEDGPEFAEYSDEIEEEEKEVDEIVED